MEAFHYEAAEVGEAMKEDGTNERRVVIRDKLNRDILPKLSKCINGKVCAVSL